MADSVTEGEAALACLERAPYDVVLLDIKMPVPGGLQLLRRVKDRWPHIAVVLYTGSGSARDVQEGLRLGAFDCLMMPVQIDALVDVLRAAAQKEAHPLE